LERIYRVLRLFEVVEDVELESEDVADDPVILSGS
jgi:hypothetical protein